MGIKEEITKIAVEQGYEGAKPKSIAQAIDALTDTLAGEDVKSGRSVVDAIRKYAPYVGAGGGGTERVELFNETVTTAVRHGLNLAHLAYTGDITDDPLVVVFDGTEYELPKSEYKDEVDTKHVVYGPPTADGQPLQPDFSTYPLVIMSGIGWNVYTKDASTHTIVAYTAPTPTPTLGSMQRWPISIEGRSAPTAGASRDNFTLKGLCYDLTLSAGTNVTAHCSPNTKYDQESSTPPESPTIASGVGIVWNPAIDGLQIANFRAAYAFSFSSNNATIATVRELEGFTAGNETLSFTMPELAEGEGLYIWFYMGAS